jgi:hypothetical protein
VQIGELPGRDREQRGEMQRVEAREAPQEKLAG